MSKVKINLVTMSDVTEFVAITTAMKDPVELTDGAGYTVSAKSLFGCLAALEWNELYAISEADIYTKISKFAV